MNKQKQKTEEQFGIDFLESDALRAISPRSGYFVQELETMHGRPDAVVLGTNKSLINSPLWRAVSNSPSTIIFARVLIVMRASRRSLEVEDIARTAGISYSACRPVIKALLAADLARYLKNGRVKLGPKASIPHTTIVSIEFKLHDWRKALRQAARHRSFADKAYIVMPITKRRLLLDKKELFAEFGVSVMVFDSTTGHYELIHDDETSKRLSEFSYVDVLGRLFVNKDTLVPVGR